MNEEEEGDSSCENHLNKQNNDKECYLDCFKNETNLIERINSLKKQDDAMLNLQTNNDNNNNYDDANKNDDQIDEHDNNCINSSNKLCESIECAQCTKCLKRRGVIQTKL